MRLIYFLQEYVNLIGGNHALEERYCILSSLCLRCNKTFNLTTFPVSEYAFKVVCLCESYSKSEIHFIYWKELAENFLTRLLVLFIFMLFCLEYIRDRPTEKELDIIYRCCQTVF